MTREDLMALIREAVTNPRANAARILAWPAPDQAVWLAVVAVSSLAVVGLYGTLMLSGAPAAGPLPPPFALAGVQVAAMVILAGMMAHVGRIFGGTGRFPGALRLVVWLQFLMVLLQAVQLVALIILPPLAGLVSLASLGLVGWVLTGLVAGLHGFTSLGKTFLGILGSFLALGFALSMLLAPFISVPQ
jgi:hypothetical protein